MDVFIPNDQKLFILGHIDDLNQTRIVMFSDKFDSMHYLSH